MQLNCFFIPFYFLLDKSSHNCFEQSDLVCLHVFFASMCFGVVCQQQLSVSSIIAHRLGRGRLQPPGQLARAELRDFFFFFFLNSPKQQQRFPLKQKGKKEQIVELLIPPQIRNLTFGALPSIQNKDTAILVFIGYLSSRMSPGECDW